jgi:hypothetical protein
MLLHFDVSTAQQSDQMRHRAVFHEPHFDFRMEGQVADRSNSILKYHALTRPQELDHGLQAPSLEGAHLDLSVVCCMVCICACKSVGDKAFNYVWKSSCFESAYVDFNLLCMHVYVAQPRNFQKVIIPAIHIMSADITCMCSFDYVYINVYACMTNGAVRTCTAAYSKHGLTYSAPLFRPPHKRRGVLRISFQSANELALAQKLGYSYTCTCQRKQASPVKLRTRAVACSAMTTCGDRHSLAKCGSAPACTILSS